jgi:hypothetical protein
MATTKYVANATDYKRPAAALILLAYNLVLPTIYHPTSTIYSLEHAPDGGEAGGGHE